MNARSTRTLAIVAAVLVAGVLFLNVVDDDYLPADGGPLLPDLKERINDVDTVTITAGDDTVTIRRGDDGWRVATRDGYPADTGKLRAGLLALADAGKLEAKTANPDRHAALGLAGDESTRVELAGDGIETAVLLGNTAQQRYRYARLDGDDQAWLIDADPGLPADSGDWLRPDIVDIAGDDVAEVSVTHEDGEAVRRVRDEGGGLAAADLPEGRELSYASVVNPVAGALAALRLEDVRAPAAATGDADVTTVFRTTDGLRVSVRRYAADGGDWFRFEAAADAPAAREAVSTSLPKRLESQRDPASKRGFRRSVVPHDCVALLCHSPGGFGSDRRCWASCAVVICRRARRLTSKPAETA